MLTSRASAAMVLEASERDQKRSITSSLQSSLRPQRLSKHPKIIYLEFPLAKTGHPYRVLRRNFIPPSTKFHVYLSCSPRQLSSSFECHNPRVQARQGSRGFQQLGRATPLKGRVLWRRCLRRLTPWLPPFSATCSHSLLD